MDDPIAATRDLLPLWVGWLSLFLTPTLAALASGLGAALGGAVSLTPYRRGDPSAWVEKARLIWPHRVTMAVLSVGAPILCGMLAAMIHTPASPLPWGVSALVTALAATLAVQRVRLHYERGFAMRTHSLPRSLQRTLSYLVVMIPHVVLGGLVGLFSDLPGWAFALLFVSGGVVLGLSLWRGSMRAAAWLGVPRPADERLAGLIEEAVRRAEAPPPQSAWLISWNMANAFALPAQNALVFTEQAMEALTDAQIIAIAVHELGHLNEPRASFLGRYGIIAMLYVFLALFPLLLGTSLIATFVAVFIMLGAVIGFQRVSRAMEERSDEMGHAHEGDPGTYASALEELYRVNLMPVVMPNNRQAHPDLYDRMVQAGVTPSYPRPEPPGRTWLRLGNLAALAPPVLLMCVMMLYPSTLPTEKAGDLHMRIALQSEIDWELSELALIHYEEDDLDAATTLYAAAERLNPGNVYYPLNLALTQANRGACQEAAATMERAEALLSAPEDDASPLDELREVVRGAVAGCRS